MKKQGKISVSTENIFPIIRQWLYSSQDIFLREVISNSVDAITKRKHLENMGQVEKSDFEPRIDVILNKKENTLTVSDNGIGMTAEEIDKYINEIAYSGLVDFVEKYQKDNTAGAQIIGHFGLGFYSVFMIADKVEIKSKSCFPETEAVHWQSEEGIEFEMDSADRTEAGTDVIMHFTEEAAQTYDEYTLRGVIRKYCQFLQYPIFFNLIDEKEEKDEKEETAEQTDQAADNSADQEAKPINNIDPLWNKKPSEAEKEDYLNFYRELFPGSEDPLFWVHLNLDYPFRLKGILYFPKFDLKYESLEGRIKVYYNQVYVADNIPEIIPEFLFLLKGAIDCPDLPLNVSRSFLQDDQYVKKLSSHIVKKVADRLLKAAKDDPEQYQKWWQDLQIFIKYGMLRDPKFADRVEEIALLKNHDGSYTYLKDITENQIYYIPQEHALSAYVAMAEKEGKKVYVMAEDIDIQWMSFLEFSSQGKRRFVRVDADDEKSEQTQDSVEQSLKDRFADLLQKQEKQSYLLKYQASGAESLPLIIRENEQYRRTKELLAQIEATADEQTKQSFREMLNHEEQQPTLIVNTDQPLLETLAKSEDESARKLLDYFLKLAKLGQNELTGKDFNDFLQMSAEFAFASKDLTVKTRQSENRSEAEQK